MKKSKQKNLDNDTAKKKKKKNPEEIAQTVADHIDKAYRKIQKLIQIKENDLYDEPAREGYNSRQYIRLQMMERLLEQCADIAEEYGEDQ